MKGSGRRVKANVAVLLGGRSVEHEISVISAVQAINCLDTEKYEIYPVYIAKDCSMYYGECLRDIASYRDIPAMLAKCEPVYFLSEGGKTYLYPHKRKFFGKPKPVALIDVALPVVHGTNVEDGTTQGFLRAYNLPFAGCDVLASAVCMDKFATKMLLRAAGIPVLDCLLFSQAEAKGFGTIIKSVEEKFGYPVIVKPVNLGSSVGISRAKSGEELEEALSLAFTFAERVLVEPAVQNLREVNCAVLGDADEAIPSECEEPVATDEILSYADKYLEGGQKSGGSKGMACLKRKIPAEISPELKKNIQDAAVKAIKCLGCEGVVRIDFLTDRETGEFWLNELNTIPGSLAFYLWEPIGIKYPELLDRLISLALKRHRKQSEIVYSFDTNILASAGALGSKGSKGNR